MFTVPIIPLSCSFVSSSRALFLSAPHWALRKPGEEAVILEQGKYLPSWVSEVVVGVTGASDVIVSVKKKKKKKNWKCSSNRYIKMLRTIIAFSAFLVFILLRSVNHMSKSGARLLQFLLIGHYRVVPSLCFKKMLSAKPDNDWSSSNENETHLHRKGFTTSASCLWSCTYCVQLL